MRWKTGELIAARKRQAGLNLDSLSEYPDGYSETAFKAAWAQRFDGFTQWLRAREEQRLIVVAHHRFFKEGLGIELENCEVVQFTLDEQGWQLAKRQPGQGGGDGAGEHEPPSAPPPFPVGVPPVMQAQVSRAAQYFWSKTL